MSNKFKIHLYKVQWQPDSQPLEDVLESIANKSLEERLKTIRHQDLRLDEFKKPDQKRPYWLLDFGNMRSSGPGKASRKLPTQSFPLQKGELFAEETAALYDPVNRAILIQYNHYGPRVGSIQTYLSDFHQSVNNIYDFDIVLNSDAQVRLANKKLFTKLIMKVAPANLTDNFRKNNISLATALSTTHKSFGSGDFIRLEISLEKGSNKFLKLKDILGSLKKLMGESDAIKVLKIAGKENSSEKSELINLLESKLEKSFSNLRQDDGLRIIRDDRWDALENTYNSWKSYIGT